MAPELRVARGDRRLASVLSLVDFILLVMLVPLYWFPFRWPVATLVALPLIPLSWLVRRQLTKQIVGSCLEPTTQVVQPLALACLLLSTAAGSFAVIDWYLALPKMLGMALGCAAFVAATNTLVSFGALQRTVAVITGLTACVVLVTPFGTEWSAVKFPTLAPAYERIPLLVHGLTSQAGNGGIHPNELAGILVLLGPTLVAQAIAPAQRTPRTGTGSQASPLRAGGAFTSIAVASVGVTALLLLGATQSRSGLTGAGVALLMLGAYVLWLVDHQKSVPSLVVRGSMIVYVIALLGAVWLGAQTILNWTSSSGAPSRLDSFESRVELWERASQMVRDFPLSGIGVGQFDPVLRAAYTPFLSPPGEYVPHAHSIVLAFAVELGLPGAVGLLTILTSSLRECLHASRSDEPLLSRTGVGVALGLIAFSIYGLTDAIGPGARAGLLFWLLLGVGNALGRLASSSLPSAR